MNTSLKKFLWLVGVGAVSLTAAMAQVNVSITIAPPELPVYEQPPCPVEGYLWSPGYWGYADGGYYWVPGVWAEPPRPRVLWTPGYWAFADSVYVFHAGYWGEHVGFYGGVNYGFGYGGVGYGGGNWEGDIFRYNTAITRVNTTVIHNTYMDKTVINEHGNGNRLSFNGGPNGIKVEPTAEQRQYEHEEHLQPTAAQEQRREEASRDKAQFVSANHAHPESLTAKSSGEPKAEQRPDTHVGTPEQRPDTHTGTPQQAQERQKAGEERKPAQEQREGERAKPEATPREEKLRPEATPREERSRPEAKERETRKPEATPREERPRPEAAPHEEKPRPEAAAHEEPKKDKPQ